MYEQMKMALQTENKRKKGNNPFCRDCYYFHMECEDDKKEHAKGYCYNKRMFEKDCQGNRRENVPDKWRTEPYFCCRWFEDAYSRQNHFDAVTEVYNGKTDY